jgi:PIN domain nuclease of toxin-antitoxin system
VRLLLDTHTFLWAAGDPARLSRKAHRALTTERNELYLSTASLWEMAIKRSLGKLDLEMSLSELLDLGRQKLELRLIEIVAAHALAVEHLPLHHRDPFDRMLVAQARVEDVGLISNDEVLDRYGVQRLW